MAGDGGMRIMMDIPESDMAEAIQLLAWRQKVLRVTVTPDGGGSARKDAGKHY